MHELLKYRITFARYVMVLWLLLFLSAPIKSHAWFWGEEKKGYESKKYPVRELKFKKASTTRVGWLDNESVAFSLPVNLGEPDQYSRVVFYNTVTNTLTETEYPGEVRCVAGSKLLTQRERLSKSDIVPPEYFEVDLVAQKFRPVAYQAGKILAAWTCDFFQYLNVAQDGSRYYEVPLLGGDKIVQPQVLNKQDRGYLTIVKSDGEINRSFIGGDFSISPYDFQFCKWNGAIHIGAPTTVNSLTIYEGGRVEAIRPPLFLRDLALTMAAGGFSRAVRDGVIWFQFGQGYFWESQGIYFQRRGENKIIKIDGGRWSVGQFLSISPDGCSVFGLRTDGNPRTSRRARMSIINTCRDQE